MKQQISRQITIIVAILVQLVKIVSIGVLLGKHAVFFVVIHATARHSRLIARRLGRIVVQRPAVDSLVKGGAKQEIAMRGHTSDQASMANSV